MQNVNPITTVKGLQTNNSELSQVEQGSLADCNNVVLNKDSILEPRRGLKLYGNTMGSSPSQDQARQLFSYKNRILRHFGSNGGTTLQFDDGSGNFSSFSGTYTENNIGQRICHVKSNGNFYFGTSNGVQKISASSASQLSTASGYITSAGGIKALDNLATINSQTGFLTQNSKVAYRVVWGIKDANNNLILGSPSSRIVIESSIQAILTTDFNSLLAQLDNSAPSSGADELSDTNYVSTLKIPTDTTSPTTLKNNLILLADKLENDINLIADSTFTRTTTSASVTTNVATINFSGALPAWLVLGNQVKITNFTAAGLTVLNGTWTITSVGATSFTFNITTPDVGVTADVNAKVLQHEFNAITQPADPSNPASTAELEDIQAYYDAIVEVLQLNPSTKNPADFDTNSSTQSSTVDLTFTIPDGVTTAYFYQVYRTAVFKAEGAISLDDVDPGEEMGLVLEANPTSAEITAKSVSIHDITPESFRGANLYTNPQSGEGILQANEVPPVCNDTNLFKGSVFYANTKTKHRLQFSLLGVANFVSGSSSISISNGTVTNTYTFVSPTAEASTFTAVADIAGSLAGTYLTINSGKDETSYYVWYKVSGVGADPAIAGKTPVLVEIATGDTANTVASATRTKLNQLSDFTITGATDQIIATCIKKGITTDSTVGTSGFSLSITQGTGEDESLNQVLLSDLATPSQQVEETSKSLVRIINKESTSPVYAFYLSGVNDVPGLILLESRTLSNPKFYVGCDDAALTGASFNPVLPEVKPITAISVANPTSITSTAHDLSSGNEIVIFNSDSSPVVDGVKTVTVTGLNTFTVPVNVVVIGTTGSFFSTSVASDNEELSNRIYYSKFQQPEAVPIINNIDVGSKDSPILRIIPLRDSLFVLKDDGIFRISGESALTGFSLTPFDNSTILTNYDSPAVLNNQVYCLTNQGVVSISDTGISVVSRQIENLFIPLVQYPHFMSATFGISYESDRSYLLFTLSNSTDTKSTVCYRYNVFTNAWTKWDVEKTCGLINSDILYLGAADTNKIEQERKNFARTDYADREESRTLNTASVNGTAVSIGSITNVSVGDVLLQTQYLTIYQLNQLLEKLDNDTGVTDSDYVSLLEAVPGDNLRDILTSLATKLDADVGVADSSHSAAISAYTNSFSDTQAAFNVIINKLNANITVNYTNYALSSGTVDYESVITAVTSSTNVVTTAFANNFIAGPVTIFNHIPLSATWNVQTFGNPEIFKQVSEAKFIFDRTDFSEATLSFSSDISPSQEEITFTQYGNGAFGSQNFNRAHFGGNGDRSPLRTYVPRNKQRCRLLIPKITHAIAREHMSVLGYSIQFKAYSGKAYR